MLPLSSSEPWFDGDAANVSGVAYHESTPTPEAARKSDFCRDS
jgi:hypothetical protein